MKVSEITVENIVNFIRITEVDENTEKELESYLNIAKNYIENYTGIPEKSDDEEAETLDSYSDFVIVVYILCQDMYDNRNMYTDKSHINNTIKTILDMHTRNNI